ncbi:MAG: hypothetical protein EXR75_12705 [Myxococcales bacterium]|nr:hypothetical protein [Myxococcales bacterium]
MRTTSVAAVKRLSVVLVLALGVALLPARALAANEAVLTSKVSCTNAHAVLGWSIFSTEEQHKVVWSKIGWILARRTWLTQVENVEPGVTRQLAFTQHRVKGNPKAHAYVAQCGFGGTCNEIAAIFTHGYKGVGVAHVDCGRLPSILIEPVRPEIPIATAAELAAADADALEELSDDDDDDDDDDAAEDDDDADDDDADEADDGDVDAKKAKKPKKAAKNDDDADDDDADDDDADDDDAKQQPKKKKKKSDDD